jgi:hypothetical protein
MEIFLPAILLKKLFHSFIQLKLETGRAGSLARGLLIEKGKDGSKRKKAKQKKKGERR